MAPKGKWIEGTLPDQPAAKAARLAIRSRLQAVWHYLPLAALKAHDDVEHVHQLRVATRRAAATLQTFGDFLPRGKARWFKKRLKRIRAVAGPARDDDVLLERLTEWSARHQGVEATLKRIARHRQQSQEPIVAIHAHLRKKHFARRIERLVQRIRFKPTDEPTPEPDFRALATATLCVLVPRFEEAGQADFSQIEALHQFRIQGKKLRYALEIFASAYDASFREELYPVIAELQEILGRINDHAAARQRYENWLTDARTDDRVWLTKLSAAEANAVRRSRQQLAEWWTIERRTWLCSRLHALIDPQCKPQLALALAPSQTTEQVRLAPAAVSSAACGTPRSDATDGAVFQNGPEAANQASAGEATLAAAARNDADQVAPAAKSHGSSNGNGHALASGTHPRF